MDQYKREAERKWTAFKRKQEEEKQTHLDRVEAQRKINWETYQIETLTKLGYAPNDVNRLLKEESHEECLNWSKKDWEGPNLPFAFRVMDFGYNLSHLMLEADYSSQSGIQISNRLGWTDDVWRAAMHQWNIVNPFPIQAIQPWIDASVETSSSPLSASELDLRGPGSIFLPPEMMRFIQQDLSDEFWTGPQPFLVVQISWEKPNTSTIDTDFVVVHFGQPMSSPGTVALSKAVEIRTGLKHGDKIKCRLVTVIPIRSAENGVSVQLEYTETAEGLLASTRPKPSDLQMELEKQYILVKGQWLTLRNQPHLYRVKNLWSVQGRPVRVASIYNSNIDVQIDALIPNHVQSLSDTLFTWKRDQ